VVKIGERFQPEISNIRLASTLRGYAVIMEFNALPKKDYSVSGNPETDIRIY
jgi:hypothetical protein